MDSSADTQNNSDPQVQPLEDPIVAQAAVEDPPRAKNAVLRLVIVGAVLVAAVVAIQLTPIRAWLSDVEKLRQTVRSLGWWGYPAVGLAVAAMTACGMPRLLFCAVGGFVLGFWPGLFVSCFGTLAGYYALFLFVRWGGRDYVLHRWPRLQKWADKGQDQGIIGVIIVRQLPIHGLFTNLCFGLSRLKHRQFLIGTGIGLFPEAIPVTLVGAGLVQGSLKDSMHYLIIAVVALLVLWFGCKRLLKSLKAGRPEAVSGMDELKGE